MASQNQPQISESSISPITSIRPTLSRSLNRSLSATRPGPISYFTLQDPDLSNRSLGFPNSFDTEYADSETDASDLSDRDEIEYEDNEQVSTQIETIPEGNEHDENWTPPPPIRQQTSYLQWRTVPARKPVPIGRTHTSLRRTKTLNRNKTIDNVRANAEVGDPNLVTWKGDDDPLNPLNWARKKKWVSTILVSSFTFISPLASTMVAPALEDIADQFNINTDIERMLVMSIFLLAYAVGPFLLGPLSEVFGRVVVLQSANAFFLLFNFACGFAKTKSQMMAFRFLSGLGGSAPQAIGGGVLSDCWRAEERGSALAVYSLAPFLGPAIGPIAGGYITQYSTWRWIFWSTSIFDLLIQLLAFLFLNETYHPAILANRCKALLKATGNTQLHTKYQGPDKTIPKLLQKAMVRPFIMLSTQPALQAMALYRAYGYGIMYLMFSTFPMIFEEQYNMSVGTASLNYISLGLGFVLGLQISGPSQDKLYVYLKSHAIDPSSSLRGIYHNIRRAKDMELQLEPLTPKPGALQRRPTKFTPSAGLPEHRLPLCLPFGLLIPLGLLIYGLSAAAETHWIVPNIGACICCIGLIITFNCAQAYVVDTYTNHNTGVNYAASATGASAFVRTIAGFSFPLFAPGLYELLGVGGGNGLLAGVALVVGVVAPVVLWRWGMWLRSKSQYCT